ncbi:MAG: LysR substrate-binding domain-containing protein [Burkholderiaceae bacterium]
MELRQLKYLACIVEAGSLSRASQALHVAQPALSQQINRLEDELGVKLLVRSVRGVTPTEVGSAIYQQAKLVLKQIEATQLIAAQADAGPAGPVTVGLPWTMATLLGVPLLREVRDNLKSIRLEVIEGPSSMLAQLLAQGKLDLAIAFDNTAAGGLLMKPLVSEPLQLVGPEGSLDGKTHCTMAQVARLPLLLLSRPNGIREEIERTCAAEGLKADVVAEINAPSLLIASVRAGLGYTILPSCAMDEHVSAAALDTADIEEGRLSRTVYLSRSRLLPMSPAAEHVYGLLEELIFDAIEKGRWRANWLGRPARPEADS